MAKCVQPSNWWTLLLSQKLAYGEIAAYPDELDGLSTQASGPEDPAELRAGTPRGVGESPPLTLTWPFIACFMYKKAMDWRKT